MMVGPSKILTVSYGTFSCTLEGFDDPFSTMRGIAEYFRDLAADDRYFGAEPPTPDADMLHRIAERGIQHRVEARVDDHGITLRQLDEPSQSPASAAPAAALAAVTPAAVEPHIADPVVEETPAQEATPVVEAAAPQDAALAPTESVAAKLARIRAAVSDQAKDEKNYAEDQHSEEMFASAPISAAFEDVYEPVSELEDLSPPEPEAAPARPTLVSDEDREEETADEVVTEADDNEMPTEETEAAIEEIESVAEMVEPAAEEFDSVAEDNQADAAAEEELGGFAELETAPESTAVFEDAFEDPFDVADEDEAEAVMAEADQAETEADEPETEADEPETAMADAVEAVLDDDVAEIEAEAEITDEETVADLHDDAKDDALSRVMSSLSGDDSGLEEAEDEIEDADTPSESAFARVVNLRRTDFADREDEVDQENEIVDPVAADDEDPFVDEVEETAAGAEAFVMPVFDDEPAEEPEAAELADDETFAQAAEDFDTDAATDEEDPDLSEEDEADLMATLHAVQRENAAESRADKEGRALLERNDIEDNGDAVDRILEVTNHELEETEGTRRRSAIAHLKAAVMATRADKNMTKEKEADDVAEMDQYRDDLAQVVRPRRPVDAVKSIGRRLAPLMLVTEQRVDVEDSKPAGERVVHAVRPRRVMSVQMAIEHEEGSPAKAQDIDSDDPEEERAVEAFSNASSFAEFAEKMGATDLPDVLEAAAAYSSYVEGRPHFSRPEIMKAVQNFNEDKEFTREESLRSFGQLLRHGKIQKVRRGEFTISETTRFNPEARAAGE